MPIKPYPGVKVSEEMLRDLRETERILDAAYTPVISVIQFQVGKAETEFLAQWRYMCEDIARCFRIPLYMIFGPRPRKWGNPEVFH